MSYREVSMQEIKEVLRRKEAGQSARQIARSMGAESMRLLLKIQAGEPVPSRTVFAAPLLVRGSTGVKASASR